MGLDRNNPFDAALDPDGDGATNLQEYLAGTDHLNANSYLKLEGIVVSGNVTLSSKPWLPTPTRCSHILAYKPKLGPSWPICHSGCDPDRERE